MVKLPRLSIVQILSLGVVILVIVIAWLFLIAYSMLGWWDGPGVVVLEEKEGDSHLFCTRTIEGGNRECWTKVGEDAADAIAEARVGDCLEITIRRGRIATAKPVECG